MPGPSVGERGGVGSGQLYIRAHQHPQLRPDGQEGRGTQEEGLPGYHHGRQRAGIITSDISIGFLYIINVTKLMFFG